MRIRSIAALALIAAFSLPIAASAASTTTTAKATPKAKMPKDKGVNSTVPGSAGYTGSSPLGSAQKADKKAKKKAAKSSM